MKRSLTLVGALLAVVGWYAPWVTSTRQLAALTYNALDLTEFSKFIIRAGITNITREAFLVPIVAAALTLALWANQADQRPAAWRYVLTLLAVILALVPFPPYPDMLKAYSSVEDRGSFWLSVVSLAGVVIVFVIGPRIVGRWRSIMFFALALIGAVPATLEFFNRALPAVSVVYASPAVPAWGFFVAVIGFILVAEGSLLPA